MFVRDIMSRKIASISGEASILDTCKICRDRKVGSVFITLKDELVGIVTERDFIERAMCRVLDIRNTKVKEIMSTDLKSIDPIDKIEKALDIMKSNNIKKLAVIQSNELVGIITLSDIAHSRPSVKKFLKENNVIIS